MYVQVGANCNVCEINNGTHGQIRRYNADGTGMEIVARGVRNTVGFDWHPQTGELGSPTTAATGPAMTGRKTNSIASRKGQEGAFYGFPYCHANGVPIRTSGFPTPAPA